MSGPNYFNKNATKDGAWDASHGLGKCNQYNEGSASWHEYEHAYNATFTPSDKVTIQFSIERGVDVSGALYEKLFNHFCNNGEMPYGTAKARERDPVEWVHAHMHEVL